MITANNVLVTSKASTWELLIDYFKQHYRNEHTPAGRQPEAAIIIYRQTVGENGLGLN